MNFNENVVLNTTFLMNFGGCESRHISWAERQTTPSWHTHLFFPLTAHRSSNSDVTHNQ